jgi:hypothetical protein
VNQHAVITEVEDEMPTQADAKATFEISKQEIMTLRNAMQHRMAMVDHAVATLVEAFKDNRYAEIKQASERLRTEMQSLPALITEKSKQIEYVASGLVTGCCHQLKRRPR